MNRRRWFRVGIKVMHEVGAIGFGGALLACLLINQTADRASAVEFLAARQVFAAIAQYVLIPSMALVVVSGLVAMAATQAYANAGWVWLKALLGLSVFEATLLIVGASTRQAEMAAAVQTANADLIAALLRSERITLWLLVVICVVNVVLAVWRPRSKDRRR